jgi:hypothetical protein
MKKITILIVFIVLLIGGREAIAADLIVTYGQDLAYTTDQSFGTITVNDGGKVTFNGNVTVTKSLTVNTGGVMIVNGDLSLEATGKVSLIVSGTLIITGDLTIESSNNGSNETNTIETEGVLVVGGDYTYGGKDQNEVNEGSVYLSDTSDWDESTGDISDLIDSGVLEDDLLTDFIENSGYDTGSLASYTWDGSEDNYWNTEANWDFSAVPTVSKNVIIPGTVSRFPNSYNGTIDTYKTWNLTLQSGAVLTVPGSLSVYGDLIIEEGCQLTVSGNLNVNGSFSISNTSDSPSSIIVQGTITGDATINWNDLTSGQYQLMGHSISDIALSDYSTSYAGGYSLYYYNSGWVAVGSDSDFDTNPMRGYDFKFTTDGEDLSYTGTLNNNDSYIYSAGVRAWHLVTNPYPAYIDAASDGFNFGGFENTIYIRQGDNVVCTYDLSDPDNPVAVNGGSNILSPNQGIWVWTSTAGSEISISSSAREHQTTAVSLKSSSSISSNVLRFELGSDYSTDETVLVFSDNGSESANSYDADKMLAYGSIANLYSLKDGDDLVINALPKVESETVVPLGYKVASSGLGEFTITATNLDDFDADYSVYLYDLDEDVVINLREESSYTFTPSETQDDDRFEIRFESEAVTTAIDDEEIAVSSANVLIYSVKQTATVQVSDDVLMGSDRLIELYNLAGQLISTSELNTTTTELDLPQSNTVYIIKVSVDNASYQEKVLSMR